MGDPIARALEVFLIGPIVSQFPNTVFEVLLIASQFSNKLVRKKKLDGADFYDVETSSNTRNLRSGYYLGKNQRGILRVSCLAAFSDI